MLRRLCEDNKWGEWEWVNPLMNPGTEYRTTDRIGTKSVYKKRDSSGKVMYRLDGEDTWNEYYPMVGAAPAGYGYGEPMSAIGEAQLDTILATLKDNESKRVGFFTGASGVTQGTYMYGTLTRATYDYATFLIDGYMYKGTMLLRTKHGGTWGEWEWVNPPMVIGKEYCTTERWNGKPVYKQTISLGKLPETTTKFENLLIADEVVDFSFTTTDNTSEKFIHNNKVTALGRAWQSQYIYATIESSTVLSQYYGYLTISYTKP
jgi:hypothetical protein